jgi:plastocyanin
MAGRAFRPATVTIARGGMVTWRNDDDDEHTVSSRSFDSGSLAPGGTWRRTFDTTGSFAFLCAFHSDMSGTVVVVGPGAAAAPPSPAATAVPTPSARPNQTSGAVVDGAAPSDLAATIVDFAFQPTPTSIVAGSTVTWTNDGVAPHTVTATDGSFDSGLLSAGATFSRRFDRAGTFAFLCAVHPEMRGSIVVTAPATGSGAGQPAPAAGASPLGPALMGEVAAPGASPTATAPPATAARSIDATPLNLGGAALSLVGVAVGIAAFGRLLRGSVRR